jgi:microcystin-dependent protein
MNNAGKIIKLLNPGDPQDAATKSYVDTSIPIGGIIMWSGAGFTLPSNWKLCDGTNGTPDLRGRFVLSSGQGSGLTARYVGQTGGAETVELTESQMPRHSHGVTARTGNSLGEATDGDHGHPVSRWSNPWPGTNPPTPDNAWNGTGTPYGPHPSYIFNGISEVIRVADNRPQPYNEHNNKHATWHNHAITVSETAKGGTATVTATAHENMPPFYVLAFIMRVS